MVNYDPTKVNYTQPLSSMYNYGQSWSTMFNYDLKMIIHDKNMFNDV